MLKKIKQTGKPGFLHLTYYRYLEHVGIEEDFHFGYRTRQEFLKWKKVDPLFLSRKHLLRSDMKEEDIANEEKLIDRNLTLSISKAKKAAFPLDKELFADIYG